MNFTNNNNNFDFQEWINQTEKIMEKEERIPQTPEEIISKKINNIFNDFDENIHRKINKMRYLIHQDIYGPPGASKKAEFNPEKVNKKVNKMFDEFEKLLSDELNKIKQSRDDINTTLNDFT